MIQVKTDGKETKKIQNNGGEAQSQEKIEDVGGGNTVAQAL